MLHAKDSKKIIGKIEFEELIKAYNNKLSLSFEWMNSTKVVITSEKAELSYWVNHEVWCISSNKPLLCSRGLSEAISYLTNPDDYKFEQEEQGPKTNLLLDGADLVESLNVPFERINRYCFRLKFSGIYIDYWPTTNKWSINSNNLKTGSENMVEYVKWKSSQG